MKSWNKIAGFNKNDYPFWQDGLLNKNDLKEEMLRIYSKPEETVYIRFRLTSDILRNEDGWYIDDIKIESINSVEDIYYTDNLIRIYPVPANNYLTISSYSDLIDFIVTDFEIYDFLGNLVNIKNSISIQSSRLAILDINNIGQGVYNLVIIKEGKILNNFRFSVIR
jgi:hypothetical protein